MALLLAMGCSKAHPIDGAGNSTASSGSTAINTPSPSGTAKPWPDYSAAAYRNAKRRLTAEQVAAVAKMLSEVGPCRRSLLRYAFPQNSDYFNFVIFFQPPYPGFMPHVMGERNVDYDPVAGRVFTVNGEINTDYSVQHDIRSQPCL
jgi:hypothetical protein